MIYSEERFRPNPEYPIYPPYHVGDYLEDYFYKRFVFEKPQTNRDYIGVSWTTLYCDNKRRGLQEFLNSLPKDGKYFTISQHDDAPIENLPPDTLCFSAGGNVQRSNIIPIPLVCSQLPNTQEVKDRPILASFIGSATHPIRIKMAEVCKPSEHIFMYLKNWNPIVHKNEFASFIDYTTNSKFCLCPRGYGLNSFRLYESLQLGAIPVIITDKLYLPWQDELNWKEFSVLIDEENIDNIESILMSYSDEKILEMKNKGRSLWDSHFSLSGVYENIVKRL